MDHADRIRRLNLWLDLPCQRSIPENDDRIRLQHNRAWCKESRHTTQLSQSPSAFPPVGCEDLHWCPDNDFFDAERLEERIMQSPASQTL